METKINQVTELARRYNSMLNRIFQNNIVCPPDQLARLSKTNYQIKEETKVKKEPITYQKIENTVSKYVNMSLEVIYNKSRKRELAQARQFIMYFALEYTNLSLSKIGELCGQRDHSTILYGVKTIKNLAEYDKQIRLQIADINYLLKQ